MVHSLLIIIIRKIVVELLTLNIFSSICIIISAFLVVLIQIVDLTAGESWVIKYKDRITLDHKLFYSIVLASSMFFQFYFFIIVTRIVTKDRKAKSHTAQIILYIYILSQLTLIILVGYLLGEQLIASSYHVLLIKLMVGISLTVSVMILVSLAVKCFRTYHSTKSMIAGVYSVALIAIAFQLVGAFFYVETSLNNRPDSPIDQQRSPYGSFYYTGLTSQLRSFHDITKIVSFVTIWLSAVLLTKTYTEKIGRVKYWTLVSIPVFYFVFQYFPTLFNQTGMFNALLPNRGSIFPYIYNFILNTVNVGTAILFGISFFIISRSLAYAQLRYFLYICGAGIMILFSWNVSKILILAIFPAWAIVSVTFVLPASFFILLGLDSASSFVAGDTKVRSFLNRNKTQFELFKALASVKASNEVRQRIQHVITQIQNNLEAEALFSPKSESEDINEYVGEVLEELKKTNKSSNTNPAN